MILTEFTVTVETDKTDLSDQVLDNICDSLEIGWDKLEQIITHTLNDNLMNYAKYVTIDLHRTD